MNNEPVAWMNIHDNHIVTFDRLLVKEAENSGVDNWISLYTHPAKTLTDEEIDEVAKENFEGVGRLIYMIGGDVTGKDFREAIRSVARAILRKAQENPLQDKLDAIANKVVFGKTQEK